MQNEKTLSEDYIKSEKNKMLRKLERDCINTALMEESDFIFTVEQKHINEFENTTSILSESLRITTDDKECQYRARLARILIDVGDYFHTKEGVNVIFSEFMESYDTIFASEKLVVKHINTSQRGNDVKIANMILHALNPKKDMVVSDLDKGLINYFAEKLFDENKYHNFMFSNSVRFSINVLRYMYHQTDEISFTSERYMYEYLKNLIKTRLEER